MTPSGSWLGLAGGVGLLLVLARVPWRRRVRLEDRVLPYLRDLTAPSVRRPARSVAATGGPLGLSAGLGALWTATTWLAQRLDTALGGAGSVRRRQDLLGAGSVEGFRFEQVLCAGVGTAAVLGAGLLRAAGGSALAPVPVAALAVVAAAAGVLARDRVLSRQVESVRRGLLLQLPATAELIALAVAAGEGPTAAIDRVSVLGNGDLARQLRRVMVETRAGTPLLQALQRLASRCEVPAVRRFVDATIVALERGTPLAGVLRAQAADAREAARRELVERAARQEVAMLLPVVFLVLPVSVLFALFPGFYGLSLTAP